jgi:hypothetical protein
MILLDSDRGTTRPAKAINTGSHRVKTIDIHLGLSSLESAGHFLFPRQSSLEGDPLGKWRLDSEGKHSTKP